MGRLPPIEALMAELQIASKKNLGTRMKTVLAKHKGQIDGERTHELLGQLLA